MSENEGPSRDAQSRVGMLLKGKWTLDKLLGMGGMASVYLATHRNGSRVAVKVLHAHLAAHPDTLRRFLREGYLSNKVEHPDVVHVLDDDIGPDGSPFLVMELLDGRSLDTVLEEHGPMVLKQAIDIVAKVLTVLEAAHEKGIIHRDLKPANVFLLNKDGAIKVLDFGIARLHEMTMPHAATMGGAVLGTPAFMPPEQARGRWDDVDARSDLWAMGATLFMLLTNRSVRDEAETANEALMYAMSKPVASMTELLPGLPRPVASVIDRALAFDKLSRWPTAATMRDALTAALEAAGRGVGDTIIDLPAPSALQTGAASSFVHVHTPGGLGPGGQHAGTTPSSMPPPFSGPGSGSSAPPPLFTSPRAHVAPATTPQFAMRSLTPGGTAHVAPGPNATTPSSSATSKVAIAATAALALVLVLVVLGAFALSREDRPSTATSKPGEPAAGTASAGSAPSASGSPPAISDLSTPTPTPTPTPIPTPTTKATSTVKRPPPATKNPLDQGRF